VILRSNGSLGEANPPTL